MKVDGNYIKRRRLQLKKENLESGGPPDKWTQAYVASEVAHQLGKDKVAVRTIQNIENKGRGRPEYIIAVGIVLGISTFMMVEGFVENSVKVSALGCADFRPLYDLMNKPEEYSDTPFFVTIDPLNIKLTNDDLGIIELESIDMNLSIGTQTISFSWLYHTELSVNSDGWFGNTEKISKPIEISYAKPYQETVMFKQKKIPEILWCDFIEMIDSSPDDHVYLKLCLTFRGFEKNLTLTVAVDYLLQIFKLARVKYKEFYDYYGLSSPRFMQPKVTQVRSK